jgi:hypothetical protein
MLDALTEDVPAGVTWTRPTGGFYVWVRLPDHLDARAMLAKAITARVAYVPGGAFYADGQGGSCLRLSYCFPPPDRIREGVRRLAGVIDEELALARALGGLPRETPRATRVARPAGVECSDLRLLGRGHRGGLSFEREVSLRSGRRVADALRERGYRVGELDADHRLVEMLNDGEFDVAFLALHGRFGEDGTVASILELLGLPYTGSSFEASRLAFDKLAAKSVLRRAGLSVPSAIP